MSRAHEPRAGERMSRARLAERMNRARTENA
jgi:hypothetical protein